MSVNACNYMFDAYNIYVGVYLSIGCVY